MTGGQSVEVVEFSGFRLDRHERRLIRPDGTEVALRPKVFDTLALLVANAGRLVEKSDIFEQVWPGVVVEENNLNQTISTLRRVLGDCREAPSFIATVQGCGYRFVAPVRIVVLPEAPTTVEPPAVPPAVAEAHGRLANLLTRLGLSGRSLPTAAVAVLVLVAVGIAVLVPRPEIPTTEAGATTAAASVALRAAAAGGTTLVVLPFADRSESGDHGYFSAGLSDHLRSQLDQIEGLTVMGQRSSELLRERDEPLRDLSEMFGFAYVLDGGVGKSGDRLRITAELVDATDGARIWSQAYNRSLGDVFAIQTDIARAVAEVLPPELGLGGLYPSDWETTEDAEAYDMYLRANGLLRAPGPEALARAEELFREVIARDPHFQPAQMGLVNTLIGLSEIHPERVAEMGADIDEILTRMIEHAPTAALGERLRAQQLWGHGDWLGARRAVEAAWEHAEGARPEERVELEGLLAEIGASAGRMAAAVEPMRAQAQTDPLSLRASFYMQWVLHASGRLEEAEAEYERSLDLQGDRELVEGFAFVRALVEGFDREVVVERRARYRAALSPARQAAGGFLALDVLEKDREAVLAELRRQLARAPDADAVHPVTIVQWADYRGDLDLALEALGTTFEVYGVSGWIPWMGSLKHVRNHPGFKDLMREYGYEAYWRATGEWGDFCRPLGEDDFECW